jgi:hypothetical protein
MRIQQVLGSSAALTVAAVVLVSCSSSDRGSVLAPTHANSAFLGTLGHPRSPEGEALVVCKDFSNATGSADFTVTGSENGTPITPTNFSVADGDCMEVWNTEVGVTGTFTVTENSPSGTGWSTVITGTQRTSHVDTPIGPINGTSAGATLGGGGTGTLLIFTNTFTPPSNGCTLTQGYWKTHNNTFPGGAPPDDTWDLLAGGLAEGTTFFLSGKTWYQVFNTPPAGNAYYQLAHQYMAAILNQLSGASTPSAVQTAINTATGLFNTYTPAQIGALSGNNSLRKQFVALAGTLGSYNEGTTGPGHCGE